MADLPLAKELQNENPACSVEPKAEHKTERTQVPQAVTIQEGNTGTLTIKLLEEIRELLKEMNYYLSYLEKK